MLQQILLPEYPGLQVVSVALEKDQILPVASATGTSACCPGCGQSSPRVHSHSTRLLMDLPMLGLRVIVEVHLRRFFCDRAACPCTTFSEPLTAVAGRYARKTLRLLDLLARTALLSGGEAGARLLARMGIPVSPDSLLRYTQGASLEVPDGLRNDAQQIKSWQNRLSDQYDTFSIVSEVGIFLVLAYRSGTRGQSPTAEIGLYRCSRQAAPAKNLGRGPRALCIPEETHVRIGIVSSLIGV